MQLVIGDRALGDLATAEAWYREQLPGLDVRFRQVIDQEFSRILELPNAFPEVRTALRRSVANRFPYCIYYQIHGDIILIVAVLHGSRDAESILKRRVE